MRDILKKAIENGEVRDDMIIELFSSIVLGISLAVMYYTGMLVKTIQRKNFINWLILQPM